MKEGSSRSYHLPLRAECQVLFECGLKSLLLNIDSGKNKRKKEGVIDAGQAKVASLPISLPLEMCLVFSKTTLPLPYHTRTAMHVMIHNDIEILLQARN